MEKEIAAKVDLHCTAYVGSFIEISFINQVSPGVNLLSPCLLYSTCFFDTPTVFTHCNGIGNWLTQLIQVEFPVHALLPGYPNYTL